MSSDVMVVHHRDDNMNDPIMLFLVLSSLTAYMVWKSLTLKLRI